MDFTNYPDIYIKSGSPHFLRGLSNSCFSDYFSIECVVDHMNDCETDDFIMRSALFHNVSDLAEISKITAYIIASVNGAGKLYNKDFSLIEITGIKRNTQIESYIYSPIDDLDFLGNLKNNLPLNVTPTNKSNNKVVTLFENALNDADLLLLLLYYNMENNWVVYNRILETIEYCIRATLNGVSVKSLIDDRKVKAFNNSANNFSIAGLEARHGPSAQQRPNNRDKMSFVDAHTFVRDVSKRFISEKYKKSARKSLVELLKFKSNSPQNTINSL